MLIVSGKTISLYLSEENNRYRSNWWNLINLFIFNNKVDLFDFYVPICIKKLCPWWDGFDSQGTIKKRFFVSCFRFGFSGWSYHYTVTHGSIYSLRWDVIFWGYYYMPSGWLRMWPANNQWKFLNVFGNTELNKK